VRRRPRRARARRGGGRGGSRLLACTRRFRLRPSVGSPLPRWSRRVEPGSLRGTRAHGHQQRLRLTLSEREAEKSERASPRRRQPAFKGGSAGSRRRRPCSTEVIKSVNCAPETFAPKKGSALHAEIKRCEERRRLPSSRLVPRPESAFVIDRASHHLWRPCHPSLSPVWSCSRCESRRTFPSRRLVSAPPLNLL